jgi:propionyl-CoA carboxylase alpha chain
VRIAGEEHRVRIKPYDGGTLAVMDDGELIDIIGRWMPGQRLLSAIIDGRPRIVQVRRVGRAWELQTRGRSHRVQVLPPHVAELSKHMIEKVPPDLSRLLLAPMPGLLTRLDVKIGQKVEAGQPVAVMEAMKMENILRAGRAATVKATPAKPGDSLAVDQIIVEFE